MADPDWDNPEVEGHWMAEQRAHAQDYLQQQRVPFGMIEPQASWSVAPYVALWRALGSRTGEPAYWVITGDLPADFIPSDAAASPRAALSAIADRWRTVGSYMQAGKDHPTIQIGTPLDRPLLADLLIRRAGILATWAADDEDW